MYYLGHREKGVFIGWAFGRGVPVWSSEYPLLRRFSKPSYMESIDSLSVPYALTPESFTSKETGWKSGHLIERDPRNVVVFQAPDGLADKPKVETMSLLEAVLQNTNFDL